MKSPSLRRVLWTLVLLAALVLPAALVSAQTPEDTQIDVIFTGVLVSTGETSWVVAGQTVLVDEQTRIRLTAGPAQPGMWAEVKAKRQPDDSLLAKQIVVRRPEMRLIGPVQTLPANNLGVWIVAGQAISVTEQTRINPRGGPITVGRWVELFAEESGNPVALVARRIRVVAPRPAVEISGAIQAFSATSWTLSRIVVAVDANTAINGEPQTGLVAHGAADLLADNTLKARRLNVEWREPNGPRPDIAFNGTVEQLPAQGLEGQWRVSGRTVNVTAATAIDQSKGPVEIGAQVRVVGRQEPNQVQALRITVLDCATHPCPPMILLRGRIQSLPPSGLLGVWTIDGQRVRVNQRTRLVNGQNAHIGAPVELGAFQPAQGAPIALWLRVHAGGSPIVEVEQEVQAAE
jgi:hypothetical protein